MCWLGLISLDFKYTLAHSCVQSSSCLKHWSFSFLQTAKHRVVKEMTYSFPVVFVCSLCLSTMLHYFEEQNTGSMLTTFVDKPVYNKDVVKALLPALQGAESLELPPAMGEKLLQARVKICSAMKDELPSLSLAATRDSLDVYLSSITAIHRLPAATAAAGGIDKDKQTRKACTLGFEVVVHLQAANAELKQKSLSGLPIGAALGDSIKAYDAFNKADTKQFKSNKKDEVQEEVFNILRETYDLAPSFVTLDALETIRENGAKHLKHTSCCMEQKTAEIRPFSKGHPDKDGKSWLEGIDAVSATLDDLLAHAPSTLEACKYGEELEEAIPVLTQAFTV